MFFIALKLFLSSQIGLAMRAAGQNEKMSSAQGVNVGLMVVLGLALSNALVALSGSLMAQSQGIADITSGIGVIVIGLAAVIGGESLLTPKNIFRALMACLIGSILYRFAIVTALNIDFLGFNAQDLNLLTAILVTVAIVIPNYKKKYKKQSKRVAND